MTNEYHKRPNPHPVLQDDKDTMEEIDEDKLEAMDEVLQEAVRRKIIVDSGKRRWSDRTGRYEIVWKSKIFGH